jgi:ElaB/YqjD/DUF883 family membrane-anchored ribosome-binding protein
MAARDTLSERAGDAREQIARLREQVEELMSDRVAPRLSDAAERAERAARNAARSVGDSAREGADMFTGRVREQPIIAVLVATAIGYVLGRIVR